jgi:choline dehydrogenase-like flavoprotein
MPETVKTLIIGSGVAAAALTQRLLEIDSSEDILVLEAGSKTPLQDYSLWENYMVTGRLPYDGFKDLDFPTRDNPGENVNAGSTNVTLAGARVLTFGGSSIHWGGWAFRLKPEDFQRKSLTGDGIDWPITYDMLEQYYCQAEHYIGVSGDSSDRTVPRTANYPFQAFSFTLQDQLIVQAFEKLGIPYQNLPIARQGVSDTPSNRAACQTTGTCKYCPFGARYVAANFLTEMVTDGRYPNLTIITNAIAESINMEGRERVTGVTFIDKIKGTSTEVRAERIIIAAGAIESAKLLQRSRSDAWKNGIGNDNDLVGRNFITHPYFIFTSKIPSNALNLQSEMNFPTLCTRYFDSTTEQKKGKFVLVNPPDFAKIDIVKHMQSGFSRSDIDSYISGTTQVQLHGMVEVFSEPKNRVRNSIKRNHLGLVETIVEYSQDANFDNRMAEIKSHVDDIFHELGADKPDKPSISWRADHAACTCRMGKDDSEGVVDANLKVFGVENLYVCSNGAFSSLGCVNPTLTLTALALRLGDELGGRKLAEIDKEEHAIGRR